MQIQPTSQDYFRSLTILHAALMLGQILLAIIFYFVFNADKEPVFGVEAAGQSWVYIAGGATIFGVLASAQLFGMQIKKWREEKDLSAKLAGYRSALITRYALLEMPSLLALIGYFLTNNLLTLIFTGLILILFFIYRPTKEKLITELELSPAEQALL